MRSRRGGGVLNAGAIVAPFTQEMKVGFNLEVQNHLPNESQNNARISVREIRRIVVDEFEAASTQDSQSRCEIGNMMNTFRYPSFIDRLKFKLINEKTF